MTASSFDKLGGQITAMICAEDPEPLARFLAFPFTFVEDDITLVLKDEENLRQLHKLIAPAVRNVDAYAISDTEMKPVGSLLYLASFTVQVSLKDGHRLDPSKRVVILGERDGKTKAISGMSLLECTFQWMAENDPGMLQEVQQWES